MEGGIEGEIAAEMAPADTEGASAAADGGGRRGPFCPQPDASSKSRTPRRVRVMAVAMIAATTHPRVI